MFRKNKEKAVAILIFLTFYFSLIVRQRPELLVCDENKTYTQNLTNQNKINPRILRLRISPINLCNDNQSFPFVVYVFNHVDNFEKRRVIRSTWASKAFFPHLKLVFILGYSHDYETNKRLILEGNQHNDIVQGTFLVKAFYLI